MNELQPTQILTTEELFDEIMACVYRHRAFKAVVMGSTVARRAAETLVEELRTSKHLRSVVMQNYAD